MQFLFLLTLGCFSYEKQETNSLSFQQYMEKIDKQPDGTEIFSIASFDYQENAGFVCAETEDLSNMHNMFLAEFKIAKENYESCNYSFFSIYFVKKKYLNKELKTILHNKESKYLEEINEGFVFRYEKNPIMFTRTVICADCKGLRKTIAKNINHLLRKTCITDLKFPLSNEEVIGLKKDMINIATRNN